MNWHALIIVFVLLILTIALVIKKFWPRDEHGKMVDPDEVGDYLDKFPTPKKVPQMVMMKIIMFFAAIAMLAIALTSHDDDVDDSVFKHD